MPGKADKPTQNSALQGISEQENFMIKVLFICHGKICIWTSYGEGLRKASIQQQAVSEE